MVIIRSIITFAGLRATARGAQMRQNHMIHQQITFCWLELQCPECQGVKEGVVRVCGCVGVCPTLPRTAVQLYPHADCGRQFGDRKQPDVTCDNGRVKVVDDWSIRVFVALYHLQINSSWHFSWWENWFNSPNIKLFLWIIPLRKIKI